MKIVVVEDENSIRNGLRNLLPKLDQEYEVAGTAANGKEGLKIIEQIRPDLVIMDIQMPEMDGLTMLSRLRQRDILCKVIVLTAYSEFTYAKRAIELNIENYLLKPIKIPELKKTLEIIREALETEKEQEKLGKRLLSLEQIFRGSLLAGLPADDELSQIVGEKYGVDIGEPLAVFSVWLGKHYEEEWGTVAESMEVYTRRAVDYRSSVIPIARYELVATVLYQMKDVEKIRKRYQDSIGAVVNRGLSCLPILNWIECNGLGELPEAFAELLDERTWNLNDTEGAVISPELIEEMNVVRLNYPIDLETQFKQAVARRDQQGFARVFRQFVQVCRNEPHHPEEIREVCLRFCIAILSLAKSIGKVQESVSTQTLIGQIAKAVTWEEIGDILENLYQSVVMDEEDSSEVSALVKSAKKILEEHYSQGITLEELARKLCVSEEYLSSRFRKETGISFTETIRKYRIDKIKELLLHSHLKLNQIADMVGYSDPKYMSKVFKEEVGMLPAQFRKVNH